LENVRNCTTTLRFRGVVVVDVFPAETVDVVDGIITEDIDDVGVRDKKEDGGGGEVAKVEETAVVVFVLVVVVSMV
jgi:hypothetical protein